MKKMFRENAKVVVRIYDEIKYSKEAEEVAFAEYDDAIAFEVISSMTDDERVFVIESESDIVDDCHEYLIIYFADGETSMFRNSYVDMFMYN